MFDPALGERAGRRQLEDPSLPAGELAIIAGAFPALAPLVAAHPALYPGLADRLRTLGRTDVDAILDARMGPAATSLDDAAAPALSPTPAGPQSAGAPAASVAEPQTPSDPPAPQAKAAPSAPAPTAPATRPGSTGAPVASVAEPPALPAPAAPAAPLPPPTPQPAPRPVPLPPPPKYSPANEDADLWPTPLATPGVDAGAKPAQNHGEGRKPGDGEPKRRRTGWRGIVILIVFLAIIAAAVATVL